MNNRTLDVRLFEEIWNAIDNDLENMLIARS